MDKICIKCRIEKPVKEFHKKATSKDGYRSMCKKCRSVLRTDINTESNKKAKIKYRSTIKGKLKEKEYNSSKKHLESTNRWRSNNRTANNAQAIARRVYKEIKPCEVCGTVDNIIRHHPDYNNPKEIKWLCKKHHRILHENLLKGELR